MPRLYITRRHEESDRWLAAFVETNAVSPDYHIYQVAACRMQSDSLHSYFIAAARTSWNFSFLTTYLLVCCLYIQALRPPYL